MDKDEQGGIKWLAVAAGVMIACIYLGYDLGFDKGYKTAEKQTEKGYQKINDSWQKAFDEQRGFTQEYKRLLEDEIRKR